MSSMKENEKELDREVEDLEIDQMSVITYTKADDQIKIRIKVFFLF